MSDNKYQSQIERNNAFMVKVEDLVREIVIQNNIPYYRIESRMEHSVPATGLAHEHNYIPVIRVITYFEDSISPISAVLRSEFDVEIEQPGDLQKIKVDSFASKHIAYKVALKANRLTLTEYKRYGTKQFEIQVCSMLQDAWNGIERELGYNGGNIPDEARRDFYRVGALLEMADLEFLKIRSLLGKQPEVKAAPASQPAPVSTPRPAVAEKPAAQVIIPPAPQPQVVARPAPAAPVQEQPKPVTNIFASQPITPQPQPQPQPVVVSQAPTLAPPPQVVAPSPRPPAPAPAVSSKAAGIAPQRVMPANDPVGIAPQKVSYDKTSIMAGIMDMNVNNGQALAINANNVEQANGIDIDKVPDALGMISANEPEQAPANAAPGESVNLNIDNIETFNMNVNATMEKPADAAGENDDSVFFTDKAKAPPPPLDENAQMTDASLKEYVLNSKLLRDIDLQISVRAGARMNEEIDIEGDVERLRFLKVFSLKQLHERLTDNKNDIISFAEKWIGKDNGGSFDMGICLFYLEYLMVGKKNDPGFAVEYVLKFISDNDYSARYIIPTYNSIRNADAGTAKFSHLTLK